MWALSWSTGTLLDVPTSCYSFILNSGEEEPPPVLLKSQPADHSASFSPQGCSWSPFIKQEPAPNTSTWGQCQSVSFRLHSPHLPYLNCGVSPQKPQSLQPVATPFSTTAITHLVTVLTKHLTTSSGQSQTEGTEAADSLSPLPSKKHVYLCLLLILCHIFLHIQ